MLLIEHNNKELRVDVDDQREPIYLLFSDVLHTGRPQKSVILVDMAILGSFKIHQKSKAKAMKFDPILVRGGLQT